MARRRGVIGMQRAAVQCPRRLSSCRPAPSCPARIWCACARWQRCAGGDMQPAATAEMAEEVKQSHSQWLCWSGFASLLFVTGEGTRSHLNSATSARSMSAAAPDTSAIRPPTASPSSARTAACGHQSGQHSVSSTTSAQCRQSSRTEARLSSSEQRREVCQHRRR